MKRLLSLMALMLALACAMASCSVIENFLPFASAEYTVTFDLDGGVAPEDFSESVIVNEGETVSLTTPTKENHDFLGWFLNGELFEEGTTVTSNITLKAGWEQNNIYTVTYNTIGKADVASAVYIKGEMPKIPEPPVAEGYVFFGWYLDEELTERYFFDYAFEEDITLYAKFYDTALGEYIVISNVEQFKAIADNPSGKYLLACNINCKGETLTPIDEFSGGLEGNGYKIHNFIISETTQYAGIINTISNTGVVKNLSVSDFTYTVTSNFSGDRFYGVIAAFNCGVIENCNILDGEINISTTNLRTMALLVGGICGINAYNRGGIIIGCTNNAAINLNVDNRADGAAYIEVGGVVGRNQGDKSQVLNCVNYGEISLHSIIGAYGIRELAVGGVCGWNMNSGAKIENCVNYGDVNNTVELLGFIQNPYTFTGGIIGKNEGIINNSYSQGSVTMTEIDEYNYYYETYDYIGGFAGWNCGKIYNCYSAGNVSAMSSLELYIGGFIGLNAQITGSTSTITKCFSIGNIEIVDDVENSESIVCVGYFAGKNDVNIKDCYYLDSTTLTYKNIAGELEVSDEIEANCTEGTTKTFNEITSVDFIENNLYFDRMIWLVVEGELPTLR